MEIKKNNNGKYNVELSELDLVLIANALGNMSLADYKIFCINYGEYGKDEEVANLNQEVEVLSKYLPKELSEEELTKIIDAVFEELQPSTMKDMGRTVKEIGTRTAGRADMSQVSALVKARLQ